MTSPIGRFWAVAVALVVFFVLWATLSAKPWVSANPADTRLAALQNREQQLQARAIAAQRVLNRRWAAYRAALLRQYLTPAQLAQLAAAPAGPSVVVKTTTAKPVTQSTSSVAMAAPASVQAPSANVVQSTVAAGGR